ncbi:MAG: hypothetical protein QNJ54_17170 [Prochloraceae cyanobacterium]|nr:hypothetical protein [Prochloraceae cyanobacterium]
MTLSSALFGRLIISLKGVYLYNFFNQFPEESIEVASLLSNWFTLVFFLFYIFSVDGKILPTRFTPKAITYKIALYFTGIISLILLTLIIVYTPSLITMSSRLESLPYFKSEILDKYKLTILITVLQACIAVIVWRTKNFRCYILLLLPVVLEMFSQGRTITFECIVFAYINYVFITRKTRIFIISLILFVIVCSVFLRFNSFEFNLERNILTILTDGIFPHITTIIIHKDLMNSGNLGEHMLISSLRILPSLVSKLLFGYEDYRDLALANIVLKSYENQVGFSLASNIVGEALYYGGIGFALLSPMIIGSIFYSMNRVKIYRTFPGFIFFCFMMSDIRRIIRSSFYDNFLTLVYLMFSYLIWITILEWGRVIFTKVKKNNFILSRYL